MPMGGGGDNGPSKKEAFNDGYLAGMREAQKLNGGSRKGGRRLKPSSRRDSGYSQDPPSDFEDEEFGGGSRYNQPRSVKQAKIPMRKGRSRSRVGLSERDNLMDAVPRAVNRPRQLPKIDTPIPD